MALVQFSGIASGIDSAGLIEALLEQQRKTKIAPLEKKVSELQDTNSAYGELATLLSTLKDAASKFRTLNGGVLSKSASSSNETAVTATATNAAQNGTHSVTVTQLASNATLSFDDRYASGSTAIYSGMNDGAAAVDRTVSFTIGTGAEQETVDLELTSTTTLSDLATQFNATSDKATASVVNVGTTSAPSYALVVSSDKTGTSEGEIGVSVGSAVSAGAFGSYALEQAKNAEFTMAGVTGTISRSGNTITDVVEGLTLDLFSTGTATISTTTDAATSTSTVKDFVTAYNEVLTFIQENDTVSIEQDGEETSNVFGSLASTAIDENLLTALRGSFSAAGITGGSVNILADLGITTERDGSLKFDEDIFSDAVASDSNSVTQIFANLGENLASVGGTIEQFTRYNGILGATVNSNDAIISRYQNQIADTEKRLSAEEERLNARFGRLEALIGKMQSQQNSLSGLL